MTITVGKSTYARCGIITNVTPFEPEWEGFVTLEISNTTPLPAKIYANEGIAQVLFFEGRRAAGSLVHGQEGQVPGPGGRHAAASSERLSVRSRARYEHRSDREQGEDGPRRALPRTGADASRRRARRLLRGRIGALAGDVGRLLDRVGTAERGLRILVALLRDAAAVDRLVGHHDLLAR